MNREAPATKSGRPLTEAADLLLRGDPKAAQGICEQLLQQTPSDADALHLLGLSLASQGDLSSAARKLTEAIGEDPNHPYWHRNLGVIYLATKEGERAAVAFGRASFLSPNDVSLLLDLGNALLQSDRLEKARTAFAEAAGREPGSLPAWLGLARSTSGSDPESALSAAYRALDLEPGRREGLQLAAEALQLLGRHGEALPLLEQLRILDPQNVTALRTLTYSQWEVGDVAGLLQTYREIAAAGGEYPEIADARLNAILHYHGSTPQSIRTSHQAWAERFCPNSQAGPSSFTFPNDPQPRRKLRIGYITGELKCCPTYHFLLPFLREHDRSAFDVVCYYSAPVVDGCSDKFRSYVSDFRHVHGLDDDSLVQMLREDQIDILVECSGHFDSHRLPALSERAAPVQVFYPHYPATTGVSNIDYVVADEHVCPLGSEENYTEAVYRMPSGFVLYQPPGHLPLPPLPALHNGAITFGLFQRPAKTNRATWDAYARILHALPNARLIVQCGSRDLWGSPLSVRARMTAEITARGLESERVRFVENLTLRERMRLMGEVDIALDTFPYNGQTTTCECLWMGVPVVTLAGSTHVSRVGCSILHQAGLPDWVAESVDEYVAIAVSKASDMDALAALRSGMRERLLQSPLLDARGQTRRLEGAYREMWQRWTESRKL